MVAVRHNLTRRALLGAAAAACAFIASPRAARGQLPATVPGFAAAWWKHALAQFRQAEAHLAALPRGAPDSAFDERECARLDALRRLMRAPAPDLLALRLKIELAVDEDVATLTDARPCLAALRADARRLIDGG